MITFLKFKFVIFHAPSLRPQHANNYRHITQVMHNSFCHRIFHINTIVFILAQLQRKNLADVNHVSRSVISINRIE